MEKTIIYLGSAFLLFLFLVLIRLLPPKNIATKKVDWKHFFRLISIQVLIGITGVVIGIKSASLVGLFYAVITFVPAALIFNVFYGVWYYRQLIK